MSNFKNKDIIGYKIFSFCALVLIIIGIIMIISDRKMVSEISLKYDPSEKAVISGREIIWLGGLMLIVIFGLYFLKKRKQDKTR